MNGVRKRKLIFLGLGMGVIAIVTALISYALRQNISLFYTPSQVMSGEAPLQKKIRLGGMVVLGSVQRQSKSLSVQFQLTDYKQVVQVQYQGILPDLFREGQGIVALGRLSASNYFLAEEVLAKHDANYMPAEVKDALAKASASR